MLSQCDLLSSESPRCCRRTRSSSSPRASNSWQLHPVREVREEVGMKEKGKEVVTCALCA